MNLSELGPYRIEHELGRGGMATVYRAVHVPLRRNVALKVLDRSLSDNPEFQQRFQQEAEVAAQLEHPNIVPVFDLGTAEGYQYIAMRLIDGRTLDQVIRDGGAMPAARALNIGAEVADALAYAHGQRVLHRDVKPSNIMVRADDRPILTDFGIARAAERLALTRANSIIGTPRYMSPEQVTSQPLDHRSDVYSLGIVLYEMLTGKVPFDAQSAPAILYKHVHEPPRPLNLERPDLSSGVRELVERCLAKSPDDRFQSAADVAATCRALLAVPGLDASSRTVMWSPQGPPNQTPRSVTPAGSQPGWAPGPSDSGSMGPPAGWQQPPNPGQSQSDSGSMGTPAPWQQPPQGWGQRPDDSGPQTQQGWGQRPDDSGPQTRPAGWPPPQPPIQQSYPGQSTPPPYAYQAAPSQPQAASSPLDRLRSTVPLPLLAVVAAIVVFGGLWAVLGDRLPGRSSESAGSATPTIVTRAATPTAPAAATLAPLASTSGKPTAPAAVPSPVAAAKDADASQRLASAMAALGSRDWSAALEHADAGLQVDSKNPGLAKAAVQAHLGLGQQLWSQGSLREALIHYSEVREAPLRAAASPAELREADLSVPYIWGEQLASIDQGLALFEYEKTFRRDPSFRDVRKKLYDGNVALARQALDRGDKEAAARFVTVARQTDPDGAEAKELSVQLTPTPR